MEDCVKYIHEEAERMLRYIERLVHKIMHTPVVKAPSPGRNDLCACGSGRKYKKCCGR